MKKFTPAEDEFIRTHYKELSYVEIAKILGHSKNAVQFRAREHLHLRVGSTYRSRLKLEKVKTLLEHNKTIQEIADICGVAQWTVDAFLKRHNLYGPETWCKAGRIKGEHLLEEFCARNKLLFRKIPNNGPIDYEVNKKRVNVKYSSGNGWMLTKINLQHLTPADEFWLFDKLGNLYVVVFKGASYV